MSVPKPNAHAYSEKVHELEAKLYEHAHADSFRQPEQRQQSTGRGGDQPTNPTAMRLGVAPEVDDKLYSEKVHELEELSPRGYVEDTAHKHGVKPELRMWPKGSQPH